MCRSLLLNSIQVNSTRLQEFKKNVRLLIIIIIITFFPVVQTTGVVGDPMTIESGACHVLLGVIKCQSSMSAKCIVSRKVCKTTAFSFVYFEGQLLRYYVMYVIIFQ